MPLTGIQTTMADPVTVPSELIESGCRYFGFELEGVECFDVGATHHRVEGNQAQPEEHGVMHFDITSEFVTRSVLLTLKMGPPWRNARDHSNSASWAEDKGHFNS
jgi:hypothetical protein